MASYYPPTNFFQNINFNNDFYAIPNNNQGISLAYANTHFLFSTGVATSTAITTYFSGSIGIGTIGGTAGSLNALTLNAINSIQINGNDISNIYDKITDRETAISSLSNLLQTNIDKKQNTLTASTSLLGIGNNITQLNYDNISNPPNLSVYDLITHRQAAITSLSNVLQTNIDTKQNTLTASTSLLGIGNNITQLNYDNITNPPNLSVYDLIADRQTAITSLSNTIFSQNYITSNLAISQGFLNSNIKTQQIISNLKCENCFTSNLNGISTELFTTSNAVKSIVEFDMNIVAKHYGFYITITTPININGSNFYKYDINLTPYTKKGVIQIGPQSGDTFRSFKIRVMYATMYFSYIINDLPNVCYYEVFMSYKNTAAPPNGSAGLNACAIGFPHNPTLQTIMPNNLFVIKNGAGSIDYITVVSTTAADCRCIIEDLIG